MIRFAIGTTALLALSATMATAGQFEVQDVWYETQASTVTNATRVMVGTRAKYVGTVDSNDHFWNLWTNLYVFSSRYSGPAIGGSEPTTGQVIEISPFQYGAFQDVANCTPAGNNVPYRGEGVASIYHQFSPDIHSKYGSWSSTLCTAPPETENPPTGTEGGGGSPPGDGSGTSPLLIDVDRGGFQLSSAQAGVAFDVDRDGIAERVAWTLPGSADAWLALDRNGNGLIDDGGELFGNFTAQPATEEPNGYAALAVFDRPENGGNGDLYLTSADAVFARLRLWIDVDADGVSAPRELHPLEFFGVVGLDLSPVVSQRRDRFGSFFRYSAKVDLLRGTTRSADVFLALAE